MHDIANTPAHTTVLAVTQTETNAQIGTSTDAETISSLSSHITDTDETYSETQTVNLYQLDHTYTEHVSCTVNDDLPIKKCEHVRTGNLATFWQKKLL